MYFRNLDFYSHSLEEEIKSYSISDDQVLSFKTILKMTRRKKSSQALFGRENKVKVIKGGTMDS